MRTKQDAELVFRNSPLTRLATASGEYVVHTAQWSIKFYESKDDSETEAQRELNRPKRLSLIALFDESDIGIEVTRKNKKGELQKYFGVVCEHE